MRFGVGAIARRVGHDRLVVAAAACATLCALVLLASGPIYASAVSRASLQRSLVDADPADATIAVRIRLPSDRYDEVDSIVESALSQAIGAGDVVHTVRSGSFTLPGSADDPEFTALRFMPELVDRTEAIEGTWPSDTAGSTAGIGSIEDPIQVAISQSTARLLGLSIGDTLDLSATTFDISIRVSVTAIFTTREADPLVATDELLRNGVVEQGRFTTYGPLIVAPAVIASAELVPRADADWLAIPSFEGIDADGAELMRHGVTRLDRTLTSALEAQFDNRDSIAVVAVETRLDTLLVDADSSLAVTRSTVLAIVLQLSLLGGYTLMLAAELLASTRVAETGLVHARGAGRGQLVVITFVEAIALVVPAAVAAPWVATGALNVLEFVGPLAAIDLALGPAVTAESVAVVVVAAAVAVFVLSWPSFRSDPQRGGVRHARQRARSRSQAAGLDVALAVLAGLAIWQLDRFGSQRTRRIGGRLDVDPLLILAPAVATLAGAVLALRVMPIAARLAERITTRARGIVATLTAWQVARRPAGHGRAALLLVMAVAIGFFGATYSSTWKASQRDQAGHQVGADVRVEPNRKTGDSIEDLHLADAYRRIDADVAMLVQRRAGSLPSSERAATVLLLEADRAAQVVALRSDLAVEFGDMMARLTEQRPVADGIRLPGTPTRVQVTITVSEEPEFDPDGQLLPTVFHASVSLVISDGRGLLHRIKGPDLVNDGQAHSFDIDLTTGAADGLSPDYPVAIRAIEIPSRVPHAPPRRVSIDITAIDVDGPTTGRNSVRYDNDIGAWRTARTDAPDLATLPAIRVVPDQPNGRLRFEIETGSADGGAGVVFGLVPGVISAPAAIPVVVSESWLKESRTAIGDRVRVPVLRSGDDLVEIVGAVKSFPTIDGASNVAVIGDLATVQHASWELGATVEQVTEVWFDTPADATPAYLARLKAELAGAPIDSVLVETRLDRERELTNDPVSLGLLGALSVGFVSAGLLAVIGFAVSAAVSARQRLGEFALLRALGLTPRQLAQWTAAEQGSLVAVSLVFGTFIGWVLSRSVLPLTSLTRQGTEVVPTVRPVVPWLSIIALDVVLVVALAVVVAVTASAMRRLGVGARLRMGDS